MDVDQAKQETVSLSLEINTAKDICHLACEAVKLESLGFGLVGTSAGNNKLTASFRKREYSSYRPVI